MNTEEMRDLVERYVRAYNAFDVDGMVSVLHEEIQFRNVAAGEVNASASGIDEFRRLAEQAKALFSSRHQEISSFRPDGDSASVNVRFEAVVAADLPNGLRAGETLRLDGRTEFRFRDGSIDMISDHS